jgi:hypothetical protein
MMDHIPSSPLNRRDWGFIGGFALVKFFLHLPVLSRYGYHHDELYFLACGRHLSFGYVDQPPIVPWIARRAWNRIRPVTLGTLFAGGVLMLPLALPVFSIDTTERYITAMTFGVFRNVYELTGDLHGMFGWRERVAIIADVYNRLPAEEKKRTVILAGWYGPAAAVDYFGGPYGLPKAVSGHLTYYLWGLPEGPIQTVLAVYIPRKVLLEYFDEVEVGARVDLDNVNPYERRSGVLICRKPKVDLHTVWPRLRSW